MLSIDVTCVDFMDGAPFGAIALTTTLKVCPRFLRPGPTPEHDPTDEDLISDMSLAVVLRADAVTDSHGLASLGFDATPAWGQARATRHHRGSVALPPWDVVAYLSTEAHLDALALSGGHPVLVAKEPDASVAGIIVIDPAKVVIGHTTARTSRVLVETHQVPLVPIHSILTDRDGQVVDRRGVDLSGHGLTYTGVLVYGDLAPQHDYALSIVGATPTGDRILARGRIRTPAESPSRWTVDFTSCHEPGAPGALHCWARAAHREPADVMFLLGDQIYGDTLDEFRDRSPDWEELYIARYNQLWAYQPMRRVLGGTPTMCMLDDHDVHDDWGVVDPQETGLDRIKGALKAYGRFQDSLNPPGRDPGVNDYSFSFGRVAGYILDQRSHRAHSKVTVTPPFDPWSTVLGDDQLARFRLWALSPSARDADVILIGSPVPFAYLPTQALVDLGHETAETGGFLLGAAVGWAVGGPVGSAVLGYLGAETVRTAYDEGVANTLEPDVHDQWVDSANQKELAQVLDILFDLANDIRDGAPGERPRAVFVLAGDVHDGGVHLVHSQRHEAPHDHRRNRLVYQLTSSPVSKEPSGNPALKLLLDTVPSTVDLAGAEFLKDDPDRTSNMPDITRFVLDSHHAQAYAAEYLGVLQERNMGRLQIEHLSDRNYRFTATIEGEATGLASSFDLDLDAARVRPHDQIGTSITIRGRLVMLRVHEPGSGFGPPGDQIPGEVVAEVDTAPGRFFGFSLVRNPVFGVFLVGDSPADGRGMLEILRTAFSSGGTVTIEAQRTGPANGIVTRVFRHHEE